MRTLVSYLNEKTPSDLRVVAELWEATLSDRLYTGNTFQLAQEMQSEFLQRRLLEKLDEVQLRTLAFFVSRPAEAVAPEEVRVEGLSAEEIAAALTRLRQFALLYEEKVQAVENDLVAPRPYERRGKSGWASLYGSQRTNSTPPPPLKISLVLPRELARSLGRLIAEKQTNRKENQTVLISHQPLLRLLERLEPEVLESLAEPWGIIGLQGEAEPPEIAAELARALTDSLQQRKVLEELPPDSRELFEQLKNQGGRTTMLKLRQEFVTVKRLGRNLRPLTEHLLAWELFENGESIVFIPPEIIKPEHKPQAQANLSLQTVTEPPNPTTYPPYALAWDTLTFLNYIGQNEVELTNQSYIPKRHMKKLGLTLWYAEDSEGSPRFSFMLALADHLKLYEIDSVTRRMLPGPGLDEWLRLNLYDQSRKFFELWQTVAYFSTQAGYPYYYRGNGVVEQTNKTILGWLAECQPGSWYSVASLIQKVQKEEPYFIRPRRDLLNQFGLQRLQEFSRMWPRVEGEIIRNTLGLLEWLGILRASRNTAEKVEAFALTDLGAELVGVPEAPRPELDTTQSPLLVQPNFEIMLFVPQVQALWTLQKFTNLKMLDQVSLYTIDRASVLRGLETGLTPTVILEWLAARSPQPLPQNLTVSVQDWGKGFHRVMVERTVLLEVEDPAVLDELLKTKQYADYFVRRLSPTAAIVKLPENRSLNQTDPLKTFKNKLKNGGFFAT